MMYTPQTTIDPPPLPPLPKKLLKIKNARDDDGERRRSDIYIKGNSEKILETSMLVALNRKDYYEHMRNKYGDSYFGKKYEEACRTCVEACNNLFAHYADSNTKKENKKWQS